MDDPAHEAQEQLEHTEHGHHAAEHGAHDSEKGSRHRKRCVLAVSFLAVFSAMVGIVSEHATTDAILAQNRASDEWSYAGQKDTRGYVAKATTEIAGLIDTIPGADHDRAKSVMDKYGADIKRYAEEKCEIQDKAREFEREKAESILLHVRLSFATASFTLGIIAATVALMLIGEAFLFTAIGFGALGAVAVLNAYLLHLL